MEELPRRPMHYLVSSDYHFLHVRARLKDPDQRDSRGHTLLHAAARSREKTSNIIAYLVANEADVDATDPEGRTPLHFAVSHRNLSAVDALLAAGASVNWKDSAGRTALHCSVGKERVLLDRLLAHPGIFLDPTDEDAETPLLWAVRERKAEAVKALLARGANPDIPNTRRRTPWIEALSADHPKYDIVAQLLWHGVNIYRKDAQQQSTVDFLVQTVHDGDPAKILFAKHVVWLIALRYPIKDCFRRTLAQIAPLHRFLQDCCKEVDFMKKQTLTFHEEDDAVTLYHFVLHGSGKKCRLREIDCPVLEVITLGYFQIYGSLIFCKLRDLEKNLDFEPVRISSKSAFIIRLARGYNLRFIDRFWKLDPLHPQQGHLPNALPRCDTD